MNELAAKLKRLEDAHNAVYWNAEQRREAMDAIFAEDPSVSVNEIKADAIDEFANHLVEIRRLTDVDPSIFRIREYAKRLRKCL